jgi:hypothetical protein
VSQPETHRVPLHDVAHGRSGDKGDRCNISLISYTDEVYPHLVEQVTEQRVRLLFADRGPVRVVRYELPRLRALNFVLDHVLAGGVNRSLNLDGHGKSLAFLLLTLTVDLPSGIAENLPDP